MQNKLIDGQERKIDYLRLSITDRCNLRCTYCMPKSGIESLDRNQLLTYEELIRIIRIIRLIRMINTPNYIDFKKYNLYIIVLWLFLLKQPKYK